MSAMKRILELMVEKHASDVYLSANAVALIKINGTSVSFNNQMLGATTPAIVSAGARSMAFTRARPYGQVANLAQSMRGRLMS